MSWVLDEDENISDTPAEESPLAGDELDDEWQPEDDSLPDGGAEIDSWETADDEQPKKKAKPVAEEQPAPTPPPPKKKQPKAVEETEEAQTPEVKGSTVVSDEGLRSPICVIMGHVDTGKTKLLDFIRRTNVQTGEAGGITQQIGATYFPVQTLRKVTKPFADRNILDYKLPGILIIDTPGHEHFSNLRSRGSSLCDIAILVVDIMHGIENQTIESIRMLRDRKTPFIVALNKIDQISDWSPNNNKTFIETIKKQSKHATDEFEKRYRRVIMEFQQQGLNADLYTSMKGIMQGKLSGVPMAPTSAITGEGIPDLLMLVQLLTQTRMTQKLTGKDELQCSVLEVKKEEGLGVTLDVILVNGVLRTNDTIVMAGQDGPIVTHIRTLLTPQPLRELRVKSQWQHHEVIHAAMGCKIVAPGLEGAIAGSELFVAHNPEEEAESINRVKTDIDNIFGLVDPNAPGLRVQASTLGSLEALLQYLKDKGYNVIEAGIGKLYRRDVSGVARHAENLPQYAVVLAFDVEIDRDAIVFAESNRIKIFTSKIIYNLTDMYQAYLDELQSRAKDRARREVVFPVKLKFVDMPPIHKKNPIILGIRVMTGTLRKGMPLVITSEQEPIRIGVVKQIQIDQRQVDTGPQGSEVAVQIDPPNDGRVKDAENYHKPNQIILSDMRRRDIDLIKQYFFDDLSDAEKRLLVETKQVLKLPGPSK